MSQDKLDLIKAYFQGGNAQQMGDAPLKRILQAIIEVVEEEDKKEGVEN